MQSGAQFPLTLTLSPREREQLSGVSEYSLTDRLFPAARTVSLSLRERAGVRGKATSAPIAMA